MHINYNLKCVCPGAGLTINNLRVFGVSDPTVKSIPWQRTLMWVLDIQDLALIKQVQLLKLNQRGDPHILGTLMQVLTIWWCPWFTVQAEAANPTPGHGASPVPKNWTQPSHAKTPPSSQGQVFPVLIISILLGYCSTDRHMLVTSTPE